MGSWEGKFEGKSQGLNKDVESLCTGMKDGVVWDVTNVGHMKACYFEEFYFEVVK